ncbi:hypothetical protein F4813DRAFT_385046 [Daldinia decipiens]|uniref:uncharacterized protein n=1 Tax=Daldinia decipiens TaxID=326647 RepID=UPI0020C257A2|nr:uncharacterized protein F4813DRAFT_385046 [Daldinia decipiens]KAI1662333.1 hypothetical protein F4813DRAFT_385046 [Daldinia decipiens]
MARLIANATETAEKTALSSTGSLLQPRGTQQTVNWDLEIASMIDRLPQSSPISPTPNKRLLNESSGLVVVLTGVTEFIGTHLLSRLIQDSRVVKSHKVVEYSLIEHAYAIIHNGADVYLLKTYQSLLRALPRIGQKDVTGQWDFVTAEDVARDIAESVIGSTMGHINSAQRA